MTDFEFFNSRYYYDPMTGHLHHKYAKNSNGGGRTAGSIAGSVQGGRVILSVRRDGKQRIYKAHRVIWLLMTGEWPDPEVDHIDTDATNNKWSNLRLATRGQQMCNRKVSSRSAIGLKGVSRHGRCYRAHLERDGKQHVIGGFKTAEEAHTAYLAAAAKLHGEFARG